MPRHSKNRTDRGFFTYQERVESGFTQSASTRLLSENHLPFGFCALSLQPCRDPVASPYGHIFDREFIVSYLGEQKRALLNERATASSKELEKIAEKRTKAASEKERELAAFEELERGKAVLDGVKRQRKEFMGIDRDEAQKGNFWLDGRGGKDFTGTRRISNEENGASLNRSTTATAVSSSTMFTSSVSTRCPFTKKKLKLKDLIPVNFEVADADMVESGGGRGMYCCAVTKKPITHQKVVLLRPSGQVVLESCLKDCVYPTMTCPVSGKALEGSGKESKDIIELVQSGTGFSAHNDVEVGKFGLLRAAQAEVGKRSGTLGTKGTVF